MSLPSSQTIQDPARLRELQNTGLLDTPPEEVFDRFTVLASKILGTPVVLVSLVDADRQFFKSQIGLPEPWASQRQTPLSHSFCQHVVAAQQPLIIPDARRNELVSQNSAIEDLGVIAYAGIPLVTPQGQTIGSFCAIDSQPRHWSEHEIEVLTGLAQAVMAEIALRLSAQQLQRAVKRAEGILESITDAFFQLDEDWCFTYVNDQALHLVGRERHSLLGRNVWEEFPEARGSRFEQEYERAIQSGQPVSFEEYFTPLGIWLGVHVYPGQNGLSVYFQDITSRKSNEERLQLLESVVVHANDTVIITEAEPLDEPGPRILYVNQAFTQMTGYRSEEAVGRSPRFLQGPKTSRAVLGQMRTALEQGQSITVEVLNYRKDGSEYWAQMSIVPVANGKEQPSHWISIQRDITERRKGQEILRSARDEAEEARFEAERANHAKSEFLSRMSHELRTPLNAILGFGQLLEMADQLPQEDRESVEQILRGGRHLLAMVNEVLDIARVESGQLSFSLEPVSVDEMCNEALALLRPVAAQRGVSLHHQASPCPFRVLADQQRLKQILLNLLSNAVKYNRAGGSVTLWCETSLEDRLRFYVRDEGVGIPREKQSRLFTPFDRLDIDHQGIEGSGVGLALSQRLALGMNGTLGFQSDVGQGSTFWVELPLADVLPESEALSAGDATPQPSETADREAPTLQVLYIEDNLSNLQLLERLLKKRPVELLCARDGQKGLELAMRHKPGLILLDLHLPVMTGQEVLRHLRADASTQNIPVIILSADATQRQMQRLLEEGAQSYLTKPLEVREFLRTLDHWLTQLSAGKAG